LQFPGNVIPKSRLNPNGQALMNILPQPNFDNRAITGGNYNFQIQEVQDVPKRSQLFKIDMCQRIRTGFNVRGKTWLAQQQGFAVAGGSTPVGFFGQCYCFTESGLGVGGTHIFSPNVVMEINTGVRHNHEACIPTEAPTKSTRFCGPVSDTTWDSGIRRRMSPGIFRGFHSAACRALRT